MKKQQVISHMEKIVEKMIELNVTPTPRLLVGWYMCNKGRLYPFWEQRKLYRWAEEVLS